MLPSISSRPRPSTSDWLWWLVTFLFSGVLGLVAYVLLHGEREGFSPLWACAPLVAAYGLTPLRTYTKLLFAPVALPLLFAPALLLTSREVTLSPVDRRTETVLSSSVATPSQAGAAPPPAAPKVSRSAADANARPSLLDTFMKIKNPSAATPPAVGNDQGPLSEGLLHGWIPRSKPSFFGTPDSGPLADLRRDIDALTANPGSFERLRTCRSTLGLQPFLDPDNLAALERLAKCTGIR